MTNLGPDFSIRDLYKHGGWLAKMPLLLLVLWLLELLPPLFQQPGQK